MPGAILLSAILVSAVVGCSQPQPCVGSAAVGGLIEDVRHHTGVVADLMTSERRDPPRLEKELDRLIAGLRALAVITRSDAPDVAARFSSAASTMIRVDDAKRERVADALADVARGYEAAVDSLPPFCGTGNDDG